MIGRKAVISLSLLCSLLACAFAAQSALAASATNTTAVTCQPFVTEEFEDFTDAHCNEKVGIGFGAFGHEAIPTGTTTSISTTNANTRSNTTESAISVLKAEPFKVKTEISCSFLEGSGSLQNTEPSAKVHQVSSSLHIHLSGCSVQKPLKCTVSGITMSTNFEGVEGLGAGKNEMGLEFKPSGGGKNLASITLGGSECALKGKAFSMEGTMIATGAPAPTSGHTGATSIFTNAMTKETLKVGEKAAEFEASMTTEMFAGDPIAFTTVT